MWLADAGAFPTIYLPELIMSMGLPSGRKDGNAHRLSSAAAGAEMCSMEEGIGVPS